jgi:hypothetical protein
MEGPTLLWPSAIYLTLAVGLTGTVLTAKAQAPAKPEASATSSQRSRQEPTFGVSVNVKPLPPGIPGDLPQWSCPSSEYVLLRLTSEYCLQPDGGTCTWHACYDNKTHKQISAVSNPAGKPNPVCTQVPKPCSNDIAVPEKFVPTRRQLVEILPGLFPPGLENTPVVDPNKP